MQVSTYNQDTDVDYLLKKHKDGFLSCPVFFSFFFFL
jgi:hypothetical protein